MLEVYQALFRPLTCFVFSPGGLEYGFFGLKVCGLPPQSWPEQEPFGRVRRAIWVCRIWGSEGLGFRGLGFSVVSFLGSSWVMVFIMVAYGMVCLYRACPVYTQPLCLSGLRPSLGPSTLDPTCSYRPLAAQSVLRKKMVQSRKALCRTPRLRSANKGLGFMVWVSCAGPV